MWREIIVTAGKTGIFNALLGAPPRGFAILYLNMPLSYTIYGSVGLVFLALVIFVDWLKSRKAGHSGGGMGSDGGASRV